MTPNVPTRCRSCGCEDPYADGWEAGVRWALDRVVEASDRDTKPTRDRVQQIAVSVQRAVEVAVARLIPEHTGARR